MAFHWSLSDGKSSQVSRTLLSILAVLYNVVVWVISSRPTFKSSSPFNNPLVTVPKVPITFGIIDTFMVQRRIEKFPNKVQVFILLFTFFQLYSVVSWDSKIHNFASSLFLLIIIKSGLLAEIRWSVCIGVYVCHSQGQVLGYAYSICSYGQISISYTSSSGSPCPFSRV